MLGNHYCIFYTMTYGVAAKEGRTSIKKIVNQMQAKTIRMMEKHKEWSDAEDRVAKNSILRTTTLDSANIRITYIDDPQTVCWDILRQGSELTK